MRCPQIEVRADTGLVIATLLDDIDIDIASSVELGDVLLAAVPNTARGLVLDLRTVRYVDSAGVRMLFGLVRQLSTSRQRLGLWLPEDSPLRRLIKITRLDEVAVTCTDLQDCADAICAEH